MPEKTLGWWVTLYAPLITAVYLAGVAFSTIAASVGLDGISTGIILIVVIASFLSYLGLVTTPIGMKLDQRALEKRSIAHESISGWWYLGGVFFAPLVGAFYLYKRRGWGW